MQAAPVQLPVPSPTTASTTTSVQAPPKPAAALPSTIVGDALLMAILLGFAAFGLGATLRKKFGAAKGFLGTLLECDLCTSFWTTAFLVAVWWLGTGLPVLKATSIYFGTVFFASLGVSYTLAKWLGGREDLLGVFEPQVVKKTKD